MKAGLSDAEAEEVVQETVIVVSKKMENFKYDPAKDSFKGWLLYLTRKQVAMQYRKRQRERGGNNRMAVAASFTADLESIPDPDARARGENSPRATASCGSEQALTTPQIPDHTLLHRIGRGSYGEVWLARNVMGAYRAAKIVYRQKFDDARPFQREYHGIQNFEPISRSHEGLMDILQVGQSEAEQSFYYVMELADDRSSGQQIDPARYRP
jgi:hypothetical protein